MNFTNKDQKIISLNYEESNIILKGLMALAQLGPWWHLKEEEKTKLLPRDIEHDKKVRVNADKLITDFESLCYEFYYEDQK